ncbi:hypothetical protein ACFZBM_37745 [Streptomyces lavendulae]|uniref:hypothetical protein n=1 Tax=Streptomyces lavendulae TaxID=1914 RepID=UPI0036E7D902
MRRGSSERIVVGGMGLAVALALAGWGAGQVGYEPPASLAGPQSPSLSNWLARVFAEVCEPAAPLLVGMAVAVAVVVALVAWSRVALARVPRRAAAPDGSVVPESDEVRAHADRRASGPELT